MPDKSLPPEGTRITEQELANTPPAVRELLFALIQEVACLNKRIEELEARLGEDSSNSNKPPSTNSPYKENEPKDKNKKRKKRLVRKGHQQKLMAPTETRGKYILLVVPVAVRSSKIFKPIIPISISNSRRSS